MAKTISVLSGRNVSTLGAVEKLCRETAARHGLAANCRQSDSEGELIDFIHEAHAKKIAGIVINAGGHISVALQDALAAVSIPTVEVDISKLDAHEDFRQHPLISKAAFARLSGFGIEGYRLAVKGLAAKIGAQAA
jgi:3-dehydroquinate dehydratase-2